MYTIGADPEFFLQNRRTGAVAPACGKFGGIKGKPLPIPGLSDGYGYQEDNVALEFNIPPAPSGGSFFSTVNEALAGMAALVDRTCPDYFVDQECSRLFPHSELQHAKAQEFGCSPDFDAYEYGRALPALDRTFLHEPEGEWRFAGGHIHLGYSTRGAIPEFAVAAFADVFLGLPAAMWDTQGKRRALYGKPGRFRPTKYGIEYRVLSNRWLFNETAREQVALGAQRLLAYVDSTPAAVLQKAFVQVPWAEVRESIEQEDGPRASELYRYLLKNIELEDAA